MSRFRWFVALQALALSACGGGHNGSSPVPVQVPRAAEIARSTAESGVVTNAAARIASITLTLQNSAPLECSGPSVIPLHVVAKDSSGNVISGTYSSPITLTDSDMSGATTLSTHTVTSSTTPVTLAYNQDVISSATLSAASSGVSAGSIHNAVLTPTQLLYVMNGNPANTINIYSAAARGNVAPLRTIAQPAGAAYFASAYDAKCNLYVSDQSGSTGGKILKFAPGAKGNAVPTATITGAATGINAPQQLAVTGAGKIYVSSSALSKIVVFAPGANGNVKPIATITSNAACGDGSGIGGAYGLALDASANVSVSSEGNNCVTTFAAAANGSSTPIRTIGGTNTGLHATYGPWEVAIGATGKTYVAVVGYYVGGEYLVYAPGANGNAAPLQKITYANGNRGIAVDKAGNIFTTSGAQIRIYAPGATGNATPTGTISGSNTKLYSPFFMSI